ncbi:YqeB family protein [Auraticoccus monumenti]|uniref:YqeB PH domain-containing protein n=1 Tax=Auraticoccus monumenti TaxID=675864 RepID=A0A1G6ZFR2_9ACTN|nr:hypothetical protein [Auraticoccus monumenti]SDE00546.1 hypothetical protein SAMN04489747_2257 [Auraticoccus monumenti]
MSDTPVRIGPTTSDLTAAAALLGAGGLLLGLLLPWLAALLLGLPWVPFQGPLELVRVLQDTVPVWVLPLVGLVGGGLLGWFGSADDPVVTVSARELVITQGSQRQRFARSQVAEVEVHEGHLVVRDAADVELTHEKVSGDVGALGEALRRFDWPTPTSTT